MDAATLTELNRGEARAEAIIAQFRTERLLFHPPDLGILVAEGDSWFNYPVSDVLSELRSRGWDVRSTAHAGDNLEDMAYNEHQLRGIYDRLLDIRNENLGGLGPLISDHSKVPRADLLPKAVLLSGGGNDIAGPSFAMLLERAGSQRSGVNPIILHELVYGRLRCALLNLVGAVDKFSQHTFQKSLPIVMHGYDYPVPDGRGVLGGWWVLPGPWLSPGFDDKAFPLDPTGGRFQMVKSIIDVYNEMLATLEQEVPYFHYVDLRGTLSAAANYRESWANELHPTGAGFNDVAVKLDAALRRITYIT
jgi:hypothetical protein